VATFKGVVKKNDLEGGIWELHADDGEHYQLQSKDKGLLVEGQKVSIEGEIDENQMGFGMTGPFLKVKSWKK
jgi:hypothetical protein